MSHPARKYPEDDIHPRLLSWEAKAARSNQTLTAVEHLDRWPMQRLLTGLLTVRYSEEALQQFADRYPDRHAQAVAIMAKQCGYAEAPQVQVSVSVKAHTLSDVELAKAFTELGVRIRELESQRSILALPSAEHQVNAPDASQVVDST